MLLSLRGANEMVKQLGSRAVVVLCTILLCGVSGVLVILVGEKKLDVAFAWFS